MNRLLIWCFFTLGLFLFVLPSTPDATGMQTLQQTVPPLPQCMPWTNGAPRLLLSPAFAQDRTIFAWGAPAASQNSAQFLKSTDGGLSWHPIPSDIFGRLQNWAISPNYVSDQALFATNPFSTTAIMRSTDGGQNWSTIPFSETHYIRNLAVVDSNTLFVATAGGPYPVRPLHALYYSENAGQGWERLHDTPGIVALSPNYAQDRTVLIEGLYKSTDGGHTWQASQQGLPEGRTESIVFSPNYVEDRTIFTVHWVTLYKSTDAGTSWTQLDPFPADHTPWGQGNVQSLLVSPRYTEDHTLWAIGHPQTQARISTDGGHTWQPLTNGVIPYATGLYCRGSDACYTELFGWTFDSQSQAGFVYKSFDYGATWHCLEEEYTPPSSTQQTYLPMIMRAGGAGN